jgi:hypothetical protein
MAVRRRQCVEIGRISGAKMNGRATRAIVSTTNLREGPAAFSLLRHPELVSGPIHRPVRSKPSERGRASRSPRPRADGPRASRWLRACGEMGPETTSDDESVRRLGGRPFAAGEGFNPGTTTLGPAYVVGPPRARSLVRRPRLARPATPGRDARASESGRHALLVADTGAGKTLAGFPADARRVLPEPGRCPTTGCTRSTSRL